MAPDGRPVHLRRRPVGAWFLQWYTYGGSRERPAVSLKPPSSTKNLKLDLGRRGALPGDPWQCDFGHIDAPPFEDAP
jgi:hypothetical protein